MPTVYVTYEPPGGGTATIRVETPLSFRVFRAAACVEGVELPGGREAIMPAAIRMVSLDPPQNPMAGYAVQLDGSTPPLAVSGEAGPVSDVGHTTNPTPAPAAAAPAGGGQAPPTSQPAKPRRRR